VVKGLDPPITAMTRDVGDYGDPPPPLPWPSQIGVDFRAGHPKVSQIGVGLTHQGTNWRRVLTVSGFPITAITHDCPGSPGSPVLASWGGMSAIPTILPYPLPLRLN
jgi:hypothetical protein